MPTLLGNLKRLEDYEKRQEAKWCKFPPFPKQQLFLDCMLKEVLYGGAAGGGKSDSILRAALQFAHVPHYSALILRTDFQRLKLSGGLIPRSHEWLTGLASWHGGESRWTFPGGATLQFGYLSQSNDKYRYGSSEYQYIAFDELTEFLEEDYTYMFSRLRKKISINVPYRIRAASNPGGRGHEWVKARFVTKEAEDDLKNDALQGLYLSPGGDGDMKGFVPAKVRDNPAVNRDEYIKNLKHLNPVDRERLMNGDWTIMPTGLVRPEWIRYYVRGSGRMVRLLKTEIDREGNIFHTNETLAEFDERTAQRIVTCDAAGGVEDIEAEKSGKKYSFTAMGSWDHVRGIMKGGIVMLRQVRRGRGWNYVQMKSALREFIEDHKPGKTYVEDKAMGMALVSDLGRKYPVEAIKKGSIDKVVHAAPFLNMMEEGRVFLPLDENSWRLAYESELLRWQGLKDETNDQIDISSYMAQVIGGFAGGSVRAAVDPRKTAVDIADQRNDAARWKGGGLMGGWQ